MKNLSSIKVLGFLQALGVAAYCGFVSLIMTRGDEVFGQMTDFVGPVAFLLLFSASAMICALLVFYKPYKLFFSGKKNKSAQLVLHTTLWLFLFFILFLLFGILQ